VFLQRVFFFYTVSDWSLETTGENVDLDTISAPDLAVMLTKFYCEATPKTKTEQQGLYHKSTLVNIRAAINRKLEKY
jgi:hypothetical protein